MTKLREPETIQEAVRLATVLLGVKRLAFELDVPKSLLEAWSMTGTKREISAARALAVDALLVRAGFEPLFVPLLVRLANAERPDVDDASPPSPLNAVLSIAGTIGGALNTMATAARDGIVTPGEVDGCLEATLALNIENAKCRRALFAARRRLHLEQAAKRGRQ